MSSEEDVDRERVLVAVRQNGFNLQYVSEPFRDDLEVATAAVGSHGEALRFVSARLIRDKGIVLAAVAKDGFALQFAGACHQNDRDVVLAAVHSDAGALMFAGDVPCDDREVVAEAAAVDPRAVEHASVRLMDDWDLMADAISRDSAMMHHASRRLCADRHFVLHLFKVPDVLPDSDGRHWLRPRASLKMLPSKVPEDVRNDVQVYAAAHGWCLNDVGDLDVTGSRNDAELVLRAVRREASVFGCASDRLRGDREIVLAAVAQDGKLLEQASVECRRDPAVVLQAVKQHGKALEFAGAPCKEDREIVLAAVKQDPGALGCLEGNSPWRSDRELVLSAVQRAGYAVCHAAMETRRDWTVAIVAARAPHSFMHPELYEQDVFRHAAESSIAHTGLEAPVLTISDITRVQTAEDHWEVSVIRMSGTGMSLTFDEDATLGQLAGQVVAEGGGVQQGSLCERQYVFLLYGTILILPFDCLRRLSWLLTLDGGAAQGCRD